MLKFPFPFYLKLKKSINRPLGTDFKEIAETAAALFPLSPLQFLLLPFLSFRPHITACVPHVTINDGSYEVTLSLCVCVCVYKTQMMKQGLSQNAVRSTK